MIIYPIIGTVLVAIKQAKRFSIINSLLFPCTQQELQIAEENLMKLGVEKGQIVNDCNALRQKLQVAGQEVSFLVIISPK